MTAGPRRTEPATIQRTPAPPPRGTRPRNRRRLIVAAAAELFASRGYAQVSMADVADAVAVRPSALYRHFRGKDDLLVRQIEQAWPNSFRQSQLIPAVSYVHVRNAELLVIVGPAAAVAPLWRML